MLGERILSYSLVVVLLIIPMPLLSSGRKIVDSCTSSCGIISKISYPFRINTDPERCGCWYTGYEFACESNHTVLTVNDVKYHVQAIDYSNQTIRLKDASVDEDNCSSIPVESLPTLDFEYVFSIKAEVIRLTFIKCAKPVKDLAYVDASTCRNGTYNSRLNSERGYSYVKIGDTKVTDLEDSCSIQLMTWTSWQQLKELHNVSYLNIHHSLAYGIEVGWYNYSRDDHVLQFLGNILDLLISKPYTPQYMVFGILLPVSRALYNTGSMGMKYLVIFINILLVLIVPFRLAIVVFGAPCTLIFLIYKWRRRHLSMYNGIEEFLQNQANLMPIRYSYSNIKKITNGFKHKLGEGGFGFVYKGKLRSGRLVAIKVLNKFKADGMDFINEVGTTGKVHHVNVIKLLGFCVEGSHRVLVYEFMANGSLEKFLFSEGDYELISDEKMFEISVGIARGIEYLHRGCDMQILHFDIKPHNILLDENFLPKLSDFGLAKLYPTNCNSVALTAARGTLGYMAPELLYKTIGGISYKADVYSFGMLLMEMAGKRKNLNAFAEHSSQIYFPTWAYDCLIEGKDIELVDDATEEEKKITKKMIMVALWCIQLKPTDRPPMHKVMHMLEQDIKDIKLPPRPALSILDHE